MRDWLTRMLGPRPAGPPPPPPLSSFDDLNALIDRCGLKPARELILSRASRCFHVIAGDPAIDSPLGTTRLGGAPDLPIGAAWPRSEYGACGFLGQLDLADVRARTGALDLPRQGLLSLFVDTLESAADPVPVRAMLTVPGVALTRLNPPAADDYGAYVNRLKPVAIEAFVPGVSVPSSSDIRLYDQIAALAPEGDTEAFQDGLWPRPVGTIGQLLGQGFDHDGSNLRVAIYAREIGRPGLERYDFIGGWEEWEELKRIEQRLQNGQLYRPWRDADDDDVRFLLANRNVVEAGSERLRLLLLIDSNKAMNLWINDADPIFLFVPAENLAAGDFSQLYGAVTQG